MAAAAGHLGAINLRPYWIRCAATKLGAAVTRRLARGAVPRCGGLHTKDYFGFVVAVVFVAWRIYRGWHYVAIGAQHRRMPRGRDSNMGCVRANANRCCCHRAVQTPRRCVVGIEAVTHDGAAGLAICIGRPRVRRWSIGSIDKASDQANHTDRQQITFCDVAHDQTLN